MPTDVPTAVPATMRAWVIDRPGPVTENPLSFVELPVPRPGSGQALVRVLACGVCRTDLHVSEGDLPVHRERNTPGHEVVGEVVALGPDQPGDAPLTLGDRVGAAWLAHTCGTCRYCQRGDENLCPNSRYTGWDIAGGYAEYMVADSSYLYRLPDGYTDDELAPLLCAGIIGFRALRRAGMPGAGKRLGLYGFGGSAHLAAQVALARGATVHVLTRGAEARGLALALGCASARDAYDAPPEPLDAAIIFAPVGEMVPVAMRALDRGGVLACAGIYMTPVPELDYERDLFYERELRSVTSNTRGDGRDFLAFAAQHHLAVTAHPYPLSQGQRALQDLKAGAFAGAAVLVPALG